MVYSTLSLLLLIIENSSRGKSSKIIVITFALIFLNIKLQKQNTIKKTITLKMAVG